MKHLFLNLSLLLLNTMAASRNIFLDDDNAGKDQRDLFRDLSFSFSCDGKLPGFYADVTYDCKIFHVCTENGDRLPILCPFKTLFDQRQRMCTDEEDVPCEESERWYYLDSSNYYSYFMESKKSAEVILEEIDVYTVRPLDDD